MAFGYVGLWESPNVIWGSF